MTDLLFSEHIYMIYATNFGDKIQVREIRSWLWKALNIKNESNTIYNIKIGQRAKRDYSFQIDVIWYGMLVATWPLTQNVK